jgi:glycine dehydrogenase
MVNPAASLAYLSCSDEFIGRHIGPSNFETQAMLNALGADDLDGFMEKILPATIRAETTASLDSSRSESEALAELKAIASQNTLCKNYLGLGYHPTHTPLVILRNVLENPGWYTAYTPYQPEIAQGRLEGLLNFQQMVMDLTGMEMANASMLDEGTAAAEAMAMAKRVAKANTSNRFFVHTDVHPQTLAVVATRAEHFGFEVVQGQLSDLAAGDYFGALLQYPGSSGALVDLRGPIETIHAHQALAIVAADLLSLVMLEAPGHLGADIVVGSNQRFGIPMGFGGPHAGFFAFRDDYKRSAPGRIIGVSIDKRGKQALRMAMQTREQHIRREKANSNICTSQVLLALMSVFYAIYHGPEGLKRIATRTHTLTKMLAAGLTQAGVHLRHAHYFDTLVVETGPDTKALFAKAQAQGINLRNLGDALSISLNETTSVADVAELLGLFGVSADLAQLEQTSQSQTPIGSELARTSSFLTHPVFNRYHSETEMLRYLKRLESKDIALNQAMIPLGSCTMKLNATAEMVPVTWPEFANMHPFAPLEQAK